MLLQRRKDSFVEMKKENKGNMKLKIASKKSKKVPIVEDLYLDASDMDEYVC